MYGFKLRETSVTILSTITFTHNDINSYWKRHSELEISSVGQRNTFFENPSELILERWILHFKLLDEIFRVNRITVFTPPGTRDLPQRGTDSLSIRVIMQGQHYFPSSLSVTGLLPLILILSAVTSPRKFLSYYRFTIYSNHNLFEISSSKRLSWRFKSTTKPFFLLK